MKEASWCLLSTWLFSASCVVDALWLVLTCNTKIFTFHVHSPLSIHIFQTPEFLVINLPNLFLSVPWPANQSTHHCHVPIYYNLRPLFFPQKIEGRVQSLKLCPLVGFYLLSFFLGHPWKWLLCTSHPFSACTACHILIQPIHKLSSGFCHPLQLFFGVQFMRNCFQAFLTLRLGDSNRTQLVMGISSHMVT